MKMGEGLKRFRALKEDVQCGSTNHVYCGTNADVWNGSVAMLFNVVVPHILWYLYACFWTN